jgi:hypothetical protein
MIGSLVIVCVDLYILYGLPRLDRRPRTALVGDHRHISEMDIDLGPDPWDPTRPSFHVRHPEYPHDPSARDLAPA